jgi:hypothetical protein
VGDRDRALVMSQQHMDFVIDAVLANAATMLSCHLYGCRVVQRILEHATTPETIILVLNEVVHKSRTINTNANKIAIPLSKSGATVEFCTWRAKKFASNVVEKALEAWQWRSAAHHCPRNGPGTMKEHLCVGLIPCETHLLTRAHCFISQGTDEALVATSALDNGKNTLLWHRAHGPRHVRQQCRAGSPKHPTRSACFLPVLLARTWDEIGHANSMATKNAKLMTHLLLLQT